MCGARPPNYSLEASLLRRAASLAGLQKEEASLPPALHSSKSYSELQQGLAQLRLDRVSSQQSGSDDTGRSSPSEHLLRSRSPCAVLYGSEASDLQSSPGRPAEVAAAAEAEQRPALPGPPGPAGQLLPTDHPFLESAAAFSIVDVPLAARPEAAPASGAAADRAAGTSGAGAVGISPMFSDRAGSCSLDAAAAAAVAADADPVRAAAMAASCAAYLSAAAATASAASSPPSSAFSTLPSSPQHQQQQAAVALPPLHPAAAAPPLSPFARAASPVPAGAAPGLPVPLGGLSVSRQNSLRAVQQPPSLLSQCDLATAPGSSAGSSPTSTSQHSRSGSLSGEMALAGAAARAAASVDAGAWGTSTHLSEGHAAEELFYRLNHARQTVDFVKRQATAFSQLNKATMGVWEALELLNTLREYETALLGPGDDAPVAAAGPLPAPDMPLLEHALQCAEACRAAWPDEEHMHLAGLLAPLGKLLAHAKFGAEPQWAICGETFPVGCRFHPSIRHSQFFSANPDRRKRLYSSPSGVYREGCGLGGVLMSWGAGEYLHLVLRLNRVALPPEALFCIRHLKLRCVFRPGGPYSELLSEFDRVQLPRLAKFQQLCAYRAAPRAGGEPLMVPAPPGGVGGEGEGPAMQVNPRLKQYYDGLMAKFMPQAGVLRW